MGWVPEVVHASFSKETGHYLLGARFEYAKGHGPHLQM